jgi:hypothetical protein
MSILSYETLIVSNPPKPSELYRLGWNAYCNGLPYAELTTDAEKRGYMAANRSQAETLTDGYAQSMRW